MKISTPQHLLAIKMMADGRLPRNAFGYVQDIISPTITASVMQDRLAILRDYVPDLVNNFEVSLFASALGSKGGAVKSDKKTSTSRENGKKGGRPPRNS